MSNDKNNPPSVDSDEWLRLTGRTLKDIETEAIRRAISRNGGDTTEAAKELGVSRSMLKNRAPENQK